MPIALLSVLLLTIGVNADDIRALPDLGRPPIKYRVTIGPKSEDDFLAEATAVLGPKSIRMGTLSAYANAEDYVVAGASTNTYVECSYGSSRSILENYKRTHAGCPVVREVAKIGDSLLYRSLDQQCRVTRKVLTGKDPLKFAVNGQQVEVLEMKFSPTINLKGPAEIATWVFARTNGTPSKKTAQAVLAYLRTATDVGNMTVELASDPWFFNNCEFPTWYPFEAFPGLPTKDRFERSPESTCYTMRDGSIKCLGA